MKFRNRGFVVLVPGKKSLKPLQSLCFQQSYNQCYTVRYRISAGSVFGTLFIALVTDLLRTSGKWQPQGLFEPELTELDAEELASARANLENLVPEELLDRRAGELSADAIVESLQLVERMTSSAIGKRFVLFCAIAYGASHLRSAESRSVCNRWRASSVSPASPSTATRFASERTLPPAC